MNPKREWCAIHGVHKPCPGCRSDELAARGEQAAGLVGQGVPRERVRQILADHQPDRPDVRAAAAGEREDDDG